GRLNVDAQLLVCVDEAGLGRAAVASSAGGTVTACTAVRSPLRGHAAGPSRSPGAGHVYAGATRAGAGAAGAVRSARVPLRAGPAGGAAGHSSSAGAAATRAVGTRAATPEEWGHREAQAGKQSSLHGAPS